LIEQTDHSVRVSDITRLYTREKRNLGLLRRAAEVEALPESWKSYFHERIKKLADQGG
jgi:MOSC domain-containing protein YiiM